MCLEWPLDKRPVQLGFTLIAAIVPTFAALAQIAAPDGPRSADLVVSMGQPTQWRPYASLLGLTSRASPGGVGALVGVERSVLNPIPGMLAASTEAFVGRRAGIGTMSLRALADVPVLGLGLGADWRMTTGDLDPLFVFQTAMRRGGLIGHGSMARVEWLPTRNRGVNAGVEIPLRQPFAGRTRQRQTAFTIS